MKKNTQIYSGFPEMMTTVFDLFSDPIVIASLDSRIVYANMSHAKLSSLKKSEELIGRYYEEVQCPLYQNEQAVQQWKNQDKHMINNPLKELRMLEIHPEGASYPFINRKLPLYNENKELVGILNHVKFLEIYSPNDFIKGKLPGSLLLNRPDDFFTEKECEVIFLKLQGMTSKAIASIIHRSPRTVENMIQRLYEKSGVCHATDFVEFCEKRNLHRYLPLRFIEPMRFSYDSDYTEI